MPETPEQRLLDAIFPDPDKNPVPDFNDLVRAAFEAQEGFDNWDKGETYYSCGGLQVPAPSRVCTLEQVVAEWASANIAIVDFVFKHGAKIKQLEQESLRAALEEIKE